MNAPVSMETFCDAYNNIKNEENKKFLIKRYFAEIYLYGEGEANGFGTYTTKLFSDNQEYGSFTRDHYKVFEQVIDEYVNGKLKNEEAIIKFKKQEFLIVKNIINVSNEIIDKTVTELGKRAEFLKNLKEYLVKISVSDLNISHEIYKPQDIKKGDEVFIIPSKYTYDDSSYELFRPNATEDHIQKYFYKKKQEPRTTTPAGEIVSNSTKVELCKPGSLYGFKDCKTDDFTFVREKTKTQGGKRKSSKKSKKSKRKTKQKKAKKRTKRRKH